MLCIKNQRKASRVIKQCEASIKSLLDRRKNQNLIPTVFCIERYLINETYFFLKDMLENNRQVVADGYLFFPSGIGRKLLHKESGHFNCHVSKDPCDFCPLLVSPKLWTWLLTFLEGQCKYFADTVHTLERSSCVPSSSVSPYTNETLHERFLKIDYNSLWRTRDADNRSKYLLCRRFKLQKFCDTMSKELLVLQKDGYIARRFSDSAEETYITWLHHKSVEMMWMMNEIITLRLAGLLGNGLLRSMHPELITLMSRSPRQDIGQLFSEIAFTKLSLTIFMEYEVYIYTLWTHPNMNILGNSSNPQPLSGGVCGNFANTGVNVSSPFDQEMPSTEHREKASKVIERYEASINSILDYRKDQNTIPTVFCMLRYLLMKTDMFLKDILENDRQQAADGYLFFPSGIGRKFSYPDTGHYQCHISKYPCDSCPLLVSPKLWTRLLTFLEGQCKYFIDTVHTLERSSCVPNSSVSPYTTETFHISLLDLDYSLLWRTYDAKELREHMLCGRFKVQECCDTTIEEILYLRKGGLIKRRFVDSARDVYMDWLHPTMMKWMVVKTIIDLRVEGLLGERLLRNMHPELMALMSRSCHQEIEQLLSEGDLTIGFTQLFPDPREPIFKERDRYFYRLWTHQAMNVVGYSSNPEHTSSSSG